MIEEIYKPIPGFEDMYKVSNNGNVIGIQRNKRANIAGKIITIPEYKLKPYRGGNIKNGKQGYLRVCLSKDNKKYIRVVHRMVAELFISNELNKPMVNHIDGNKHNNHVSNLEWCTNSENMHHFYDFIKK